MIICNFLFFYGNINDVKDSPNLSLNEILSYSLSVSLLSLFSIHKRGQSISSPLNPIFIFLIWPFFFYKISPASKFLCCDKPFGVRVTNFISKTEYYSSKYLTLLPLRSFIFLNYWALFFSWSRLYKFYEGPTLMACTCIKKFKYFY